MRSTAATVEEYLHSLPEDRREFVSGLRDLVRSHLPDGLVEVMAWGMISYEVPLETYPDTYNGKPLVYAAIASQKAAVSLYLMGIYGDEAVRARFEEAYGASGKRMDVGKSCVRFRRPDDIPAAVIADAVSALTVEQYCALHDEQASMRASRRRQEAARGTAGP